MTQPTVAFICSTYNHAPFLPRALDAMLLQTRAADQILIVEDCSTDNTREILCDYMARYPQLQVIFNERNQGVFKNGAKMLELVQADYFCWTSSDDFLQLTFLEKIMPVIARHPGVGLGTCEQSYFSARHPEPLALRDILPSAGFDRFGEFLSAAALAKTYETDHVWLPSNTAVLYTKIAREIGGYRPALKQMMDVFMVYAVAMRGGAAFVPEALAAFRLTTGSVSSDIKQQGMKYYRLLTRFFACAHRKKLRSFENAFIRSPFLALSFGKEMLLFLLASPRYYGLLLRLIVACLTRPKLIWDLFCFKRRKEKLFAD